MKSYAKHSVKLKRLRKFKNKKKLCCNISMRNSMHLQLISKNKLRILFDNKF